MAPDAEECPELLAAAANEVARAGLVCGRPAAVATDLAPLDFGPPGHRMRRPGLQAGVTAGQVRERTGFHLLVAPT
jgi:acyl CoA:acetate/3-ketoacid CoA transferase beta subunit